MDQGSIPHRKEGLCEAGMYRLSRQFNTQYRVRLEAEQAQQERGFLLGMPRIKTHLRKRLL